MDIAISRQGALRPTAMDFVFNIIYITRTNGLGWRGIDYASAATFAASPGVLWVPALRFTKDRLH